LEESAGEAVTKEAVAITPVSTTAPSILDGVLQRKCACGNHTIAGGECNECHKSSLRLMPKLEIGDVNDPLEFEADRIADLVLSKPAGAIGSSAPPRIQRHSASSKANPTAVPRTVTNVLASAGQPIAPPLRRELEERFQHDFSRVRVHTGLSPAQSARDVNARAYTVGHDIVFAAGQFAPETHEGRRLLAHELTHVVQQSNGESNSRVVQRQTTVGELPAAAEVDFAFLADEIHKAIYRLGTDEEAVYRALEQLRQDQGMIDYLIKVYANRYDQADLVQDIRGDFEDEELEYALQLINLGKKGSAQRIATGKDATDLETAAKRLRDAFEIWGTDEEAVYATLRPFNRKTQDLEQTYHYLYNETLRWRINDEMSSDELRHALSLLSFDNESFLEEHFEEDERAFARKILNDILAVKGTRQDFADDKELAVEISKRMRTGKLMEESQTFAAFGYPESCTQDACPTACVGKGKPGEPGFVPPNINTNAHVNKDAADYWVKSADAESFYMFTLSPDGWSNPYRALEKLFTPQETICDKTLIHCDYLTTVIHHRAFAESIGADVYNERVRSGQIAVRLSYWGFRDLKAGGAQGGYAPGPSAVSLQAVQPASEDDLIIGDHVIFWNHLAYDALTASPEWAGPWRLENALLVDKDDNTGENLYEGHGAPEVAGRVVKGNRRTMLKDLERAYNGVASNAIDLAQKAEHGDAVARTRLAQEFPRVVSEGPGNWVIKELDVRENASRSIRQYPLKELSGVDDPDLVGLQDPIDRSKMGWVQRPIESAPGRSPSRPRD
jgi:hypothetical protein